MLKQTRPCVCRPVPVPCSSLVPPVPRASTHWRNKTICPEPVRMLHPLLRSVAESLKKVRGQIVGMLEADRQPKQVFWNRGRYSFRGRAVFDEALHPAKTGRIPKEFDSGSHADSLVPAAFHE